MIKEALQYVVGMNKATIHDIDGRRYSDRNLEPLKSPISEALAVCTLSGLLDGVEYFMTEEDRKSAIAHVMSYKIVNILDTNQDNWGRCQHYVQAKYDCDDNFRENTWYDLDEFNIMLMTKFIHDEEQAKILKIAGNITDNNIQTLVDDGMTQAVTVRRGITQNESECIPRIIVLRRRRTFAEIMQPTQLYAPRMRKYGDKVQAALFGAGGDEWKFEAINSINLWLIDNLKKRGLNIPVIA